MEGARTTSAEDSPARRREQVEREYGEEKWPAVARWIEAEIEAEPDAGLTQILSRVGHGQRGEGDPLETRRYVLEGNEVQISPGAAIGAARGVVLDLIADACDDDTDLLVELGSGWGNILLSAWAAGGPLRALYVAAEYTSAGRDAASTLAGLDPALDFRAVDFDYHDPDLSGLGVREHAVLFSPHSIEQIPAVTPRLFEAIRGVAKRVTCLHFEPVGFQVRGYEGGRSTRDYAMRHDYNLNLMETLQAEADAGRIEIDFVRTDVFGLNPDNPTTIVRWRSP